MAQVSQLQAPLSCEHFINSQGRVMYLERNNDRGVAQSKNLTMASTSVCLLLADSPRSLGVL